jgi:hypothetical protein
MELPPSLLPLFWDLRFDELDTERHKNIIIARIADYGTDEAVRWLSAAYTDAEIALGLEAMQSRVSRRTFSLWRVWLGEPEEWCTTMPSRPLKGIFWKR